MKQKVFRKAKVIACENIHQQKTNKGISDLGKGWIFSHCSRGDHYGEWSKFSLMNRLLKSFFRNEKFAKIRSKKTFCTNVNRYYEKSELIDSLPRTFFPQLPSAGPKILILS